jgi:hypothetical protein
MSDADALKAAIDMLHIPSQVRAMRLSALPKGTPLLLRLAAGEPEAAHEAQDLSGRSPEFCRQAAIFFIEQILLSPEADSYRILGLMRNAPTAEIRGHMALLLKWLHPDLSRDSHKSILTRRVIRAWDQLKTPERRRQHDELFRLSGGDRAVERSADQLRVDARPRLSRWKTSSLNITSLPFDRGLGNRPMQIRRLMAVVGFLRRLTRVGRNT